MSLVHLLPLAIAAVLGADIAPSGPAPHGHGMLWAQADSDDAMPELAGTEWLLKSLRGNDVEPEIGSSLGFDGDGNAFGNGGCNRFRGSVEIDGGTLKFGDIASTMMACADANSQQEAVFHEALAQTAAFRFEAGELLLLDAKEEVVARLAPAN
jgi:putative lipoprotein